jgi:uncharacterized protein YbjT (DUF2867 family)
MPTVALTGPSSFTSWTLVQCLLRRGHEVRLLCRSGQRVEPLIELGAEVIEGNLMAPSHVRTLLHGADTLYVVTPGTGRAGDPYEVNIAHVLAGAIHHSRVEHVIYLSALGADQPGDVDHLTPKAEIEQILLDTGRDVSCLRPGVFMDNLWLARRALERGVLAMPMHPDTPFPVIAARDVALAALSLVGRGPEGCRSYDLPGAVDVRPRELAEALTAALRRPVSYHRYDEIEFRSHLVMLGLSERRAALLTRILIDYNDHVITADRDAWRETRSRLGIAETPVADFIGELAAARDVPANVRLAMTPGERERTTASSIERGTPETWVPGNHGW